MFKNLRATLVSLALVLSLIPAQAGFLTPGSQYYASGAASWQLAAGHFQASIFDLEQVYPRDQEDRTADGGGTIPSWAYHLLGPTGHDKVIRIGTRGGCPPWHYDITGTTLVGASINNDYTSQNYGALTIPAQSAATYNITVRTRDQCSGDITHSWSYVVADENGSNFVHLTAGAGGTETGTHSNPFRDLSDVVGPNLASTTHQGKQVIVSGTFDIAGVCAAAQCNASNTTLRLNANKPSVWMAASAGAALIRGSSTTTGAGVNFGVEGGNDWVFAGINWAHPHQDLGGGSFRNRLLGFGDYSGLFDADVDMTTNTDDTDSANSGIIFLSGNGDGGTATWDWISIIGVTFHDGNDEVPPFEFYDTMDLLVSMTCLNNYSGTQGFYAKGGNAMRRWAYYFNCGTGNTGNLFTVDAIDMEGGGPYAREDFEWMHNQMVTTSTCLLAKGTTNVAFTIYTKRNNWKCSHLHFQGSSAILSGGSDSQYDAIEHSGSFTQGWQSATGGCGTSNTACSNNSHGTTGILNDTTGAQDAPDGTKGREISFLLLPAFMRRRRRPAARRRRRQFIPQRRCA
jgi:hypothetical protein